MRSTRQAQRVLHGIVDGQTRVVYPRKTASESLPEAGHDRQLQRCDLCHSANRESHLLELEIQRYRENKGTSKARQRLATLSNLSAQIENLVPKSNNHRVKCAKKNHARETPIDRIRQHVEKHSISPFCRHSTRQSCAVGKVYTSKHELEAARWMCPIPDDTYHQLQKTAHTSLDVPHDFGRFIGNVQMQEQTVRQKVAELARYHGAIKTRKSVRTRADEWQKRLSNTTHTTNAAYKPAPHILQAPTKSLCDTQQPAPTQRLAVSQDNKTEHRTQLLGKLNTTQKIIGHTQQVETDASEPKKSESICCDIVREYCTKTSNPKLNGFLGSQRHRVRTLRNASHTSIAQIRKSVPTKQPPQMPSKSELPATNAKQQKSQAPTILKHEVEDPGESVLLSNKYHSRDKESRKRQSVRHSPSKEVSTTKMEQSQTISNQANHKLPTESGMSQTSSALNSLPDTSHSNHDTFNIQNSMKSLESRPSRSARSNSMSCGAKNKHKSTDRMLSSNLCATEPKMHDNTDLTNSYDEPLSRVSLFKSPTRSNPIREERTRKSSLTHRSSIRDSIANQIAHRPTSELPKKDNNSKKHRTRRQKTNRCKMDSSISQSMIKKHMTTKDDPNIEQRVLNSTRKKPKRKLNVPNPNQDTNAGIVGAQTRRVKSTQLRRRQKPKVASTGTRTVL